MERLIETVGNESVAKEFVEDYEYDGIQDTSADDEYFLELSYENWCKDMAIGWEADQ